jgi:hypothetical protein
MFYYLLVEFICLFVGVISLCVFAFYLCIYVDFLKRNINVSLYLLLFVYVIVCL